MITSSPRFLFIPVSSAEGIGEYMRSLILADAIKVHWPHAEILFILSQAAPYAETCPYPKKLLKQSPTKHIVEVNTIISDFQPNIVIFDASGRQAQLKQAHKVGAKVIFISQHKRKRSRGLKLTRASVTDKHWVAQPKFIIGPINTFERIKLKFLKKKEPTCLGAVFPTPSFAQQQTLLNKYNLKENQFILFNAGSGGHKKNNKFCIDIMARAARNIALETTLTPVIVYGSNYPNKIPKHSEMVNIKSLENDDFINLLALSKAAVISGGDTLLQAIALHKPTLAVPVSKDQPDRIQACRDNQLILDCTLNEDEIAITVKKLITDKYLARLKQAMASIPNLNGLDICINDIQELLLEQNNEKENRNSY
ncbi:hypothetical protein C0W88_14760 [Photobacterium leiognathi subsp. mandapamensis]|uniref:hypothetical protein n=1 Tax=Photobacterium leiognathi TaxID=553611 RepID=UPI000D15ACA8|nr:hypothetical protein [Photobacterium leiognathi]PSW64521.1 hypothetical protein C0W88_14760 [Photobacterium leiognathi subsp. mandapamensis]